MCSGEWISEHLEATGWEPIPALALVTRLLTLQRDVREVRLACFASFTSCLHVPNSRCETVASQTMPFWLKRGLESPTWSEALKSGVPHPVNMCKNKSVHASSLILHH